jgi:hypothetical protein
MPSSVPIPIALSRFKQLPQRSTEGWQGGLFRMPMLIDNPDDAQDGVVEGLRRRFLRLQQGG